MTVSLRRRTRYVAASIMDYYFLTSNVTKVDFAFRPFGIDKI